MYLESENGERGRLVSYKGSRFRLYAPMLVFNTVFSILLFSAIGLLGLITLKGVWGTLLYYSVLAAYLCTMEYFNLNEISNAHRVLVFVVATLLLLGSIELNVIGYSTTLIITLTVGRLWGRVSGWIKERLE
jgi:hypothetical protein